MPVIPNPDPVGLPAPPSLLQFLLILTFILHLVPLSLLLGGGILTVILEGDRGRKPELAQLRDHLRGLLPSAMALTITSGVAPLLFVQLLYGQFFYTSSIAMAWPWLSVIGLLLVGYYGLYLYALGPERFRGRGITVTAAAAILAVIAYLYVSNMSLMVDPARWWEILSQSWSGSGLPYPPTKVLPRYLHAVLGLMALASGYVMLRARWFREQGVEAEAEYRFGLTWLTASMVGQLIVSPWYAFTLPNELRSPLMPYVLAAGMLGVMGWAAFAFGARGGRVLTGVGTTGIFGAAVLLALTRHLIRNQLVLRYLPEGSWNISPQWGVFVLFALLLVAGLTLVGYLLYRTFAPARIEAEADHRGVAARG